MTDQTLQEETSDNTHTERWRECADSSPSAEVAAATMGTAVVARQQQLPARQRQHPRKFNYEVTKF